MIKNPSLQPMNHTQSRHEISPEDMIELHEKILGARGGLHAIRCMVPKLRDWERQD